MPSSAVDFWDKVHAEHDGRWVADHPAESFKRIYSMAGPFQLDLGFAWSVLDVGPGYGRMLRNLPDRVQKHAIEVSKVNADRLREMGVNVLAPGDSTAQLQVDLVTSLSALQHCDYGMVSLLLDMVATALRHGGVAYLEDVQYRPGVSVTWDDVGKLPAGAYAIPYQDFLEMCELRGLAFDGTQNFTNYDNSVFLSYVHRVRKVRPMVYEEFTGLTLDEAKAYCQNSVRQPIRVEIERIVRDASVIDVCCGNGIDAVRYEPARYLGVDVSPVLIEAAQQLHPDHRFQCCDATAIPFQDKTFDFAIIKSALEHVPSLEVARAIISEACRVAREVIVAWHTPPQPIEKTQIIELTGHFGKRIYQNHYAEADFADFLARAKVSTGYGFTLWRIAP